MTHKDTEGKDFFYEHLLYLFSLSPQQRRKRRDYKEMVRFLRQKDHWKAKSRGKSKKRRHYF
jgi:hypothetical protein